MTGSRPRSIGCNPDRHDLDPPADRAPAASFSWINEWKETADPHGRPLGLELILPDWFLRWRSG